MIIYGKRYISIWFVCSKDRQELQTRFCQEERELVKKTEEFAKYHTLYTEKEGECRLMEYQINKLKA